uniref:hypothetical protein n=1 Tax=Alloprevotella sp. TaxID=1872471 RepID=UPI00402547B6
MALLYGAPLKCLSLRTLNCQFGFILMFENGQRNNEFLLLSARQCLGKAETCRRLCLRICGWLAKVCQLKTIVDIGVRFIFNLI